jgi:hypothetical protein
LLKSIGSATFWLPGSGSAKICGSKGRISTKTAKIIKNVLIYEWFIKLLHKNKWKKYENLIAKTKKI